MDLEAPDYKNLAKALRLCQFGECGCGKCYYKELKGDWCTEDNHPEFFDCDDKLKLDAANAIEELQAEAQRQKDDAVHYQILYEQWKESYEREKTRADMYEELFDIFRESRNEIIEQIGRVKGVPDFALHYPESNFCANYPEKQDCSENPNG